MVSTIDRWTQGDEVYRTTDGGKTLEGAVAQGRARRRRRQVPLLAQAPSRSAAAGWATSTSIPFNPGRAMYVTGAGDLGDRRRDRRRHRQADPLDVPRPRARGDRHQGPGQPARRDRRCSARWAISAASATTTSSAPSAGGMFDNPLCGSASGIDVAWTKPDIVARVGWDDKQAVGRLLARRRQDLDAVQDRCPRARARARSRSRRTARRFVWAPLEGPVVFSQDQGATWARAEGLPDAEVSPDWAPVPFRPAADRVNPKKLYVLDAKGGQAYTSVDGGAHFTASPTGLPGAAPTTSSAPPRRRPRRASKATCGSPTSKSSITRPTRARATRPIPSVTEAYALGFGKAARRQDLSGAVPHRQDRRRRRLLPLRRRGRDAGCGSTTTSTSTASAASSPATRASTAASTWEPAAAGSCTASRSAPGAPGRAGPGGRRRIGVGRARRPRRADAAGPAAGAESAYARRTSIPPGLLDARIEDLLARLTLEEKVGLVHANGKFRAGGVERLGVPTLWTADGPQGVREELGVDSWAPAGWTSDFATAMPVGMALASTWNVELAEAYGRTVGEEARARGKHVILGPALNIQRTPLYGRNYDYFGEDPWLAGRIAAALREGHAGGADDRLPQALRRQQPGDRTAAPSTCRWTSGRCARSTCRRSRRACARAGRWR